MPKAAHVAIGIAVAAGALAYIGLHLFEPTLAQTWSYAHLNRYRKAFPVALLVTVGLPLAVMWFSEQSYARKPVPGSGFGYGVAVFLVLSLVFLCVGWFFPSTWLSLDPWKFAFEVWKGFIDTIRWYLTLMTFTAILRVAEWAAPFPVPSRYLVPVVNAFVSGLSFTLMIACARRLGKDMIEVGFLLLLTWTAFGNLQISIWYVDIYPLVQLLLVLFVWTSFRVLVEDAHPVWPFVVVSISPFFYVGMVLMAPALLAVVLACLRRENGIRQLASASAVAVLVAGSATIPGFGRPFAFGEFAAALRDDSTHLLGMQAGSSLLPWAYMFSPHHVSEYLHTWLLIDGMGVWLGVTAGIPMLLRFFRGEIATREGVLILLLGPVAVYAFVMDPLWGPYADWDLFSYAAVPLSLFGGYALVAWGRETPRVRAALMGLLLAANLVHLGARLNALEIEKERHTLESPSHELGPTLPKPPIPGS